MTLLLGKEAISESKYLERVVNDILLKKEGNFPRAVFAGELREYGLTNPRSQIALAIEMVSRPDNEFGRVLVLRRKKEDMTMSPAIQVARGMGHDLSESYVAPHMEPSECRFESLSCIKGKATLVTFTNSGEPDQVIKLDKRPYYLGPGIYHTLLYDTPISVLFEVKAPGGLPKPESPDWVIPEDDPRHLEFLNTLHALAATK